MKAYLDSSVLVKVFKEERGSDIMIKTIEKIDRNKRWRAYSSKWSHLEVARALRKDGKTQELIAIDLQELRSHKITFESVTDALISAAEKLVSRTSLYAADCLHISTYDILNKKYGLDSFLCDDLHYDRLKPYLPVAKLDELEL